MSAVLQPTDAPSTVGPPEPRDDDSQRDAPKRQKADPVQAAKRLAESRERMRQWMLDPDGRHAARRRRAAAGDTSAEGGPTLLDRLRDNPIVGMAVEVANSWWIRHPLHPVASFAEDAVRDHVAPVVRRHPLAVVAGAVAVGALVVWFRPWRWLARTAHAAGSASHWAVQLLGSLPIASLVAALTAVAKKRHDDHQEVEQAAQASETREHEEALAPLAGMPDVPSHPATVH